MELEFKWDACARQWHAMLSALGARPLPPQKMRATYFDTAEGALQKAGGGLRLRLEDGRAVYCLKLAGEQTGGLTCRAEYEADTDPAAPDLDAALGRLAAQGAPRPLLEKLARRSLLPVCEIAFLRERAPVETDAFRAEASFDAGVFRRAGREALVSEIELEYKSGEMDAFRAYGNALERAHGLTPQPLSKLARALALH